jgi:hypothetical protein
MNKEKSIILAIIFAILLFLGAAFFVKHEK